MFAVLVPHAVSLFGVVDDHAVIVVLVEPEVAVLEGPHEVLWQFRREVLELDSVAAPGARACLADLHIGAILVRVVVLGNASASAMTGSTVGLTAVEPRHGVVAQLSQSLVRVALLVVVVLVHGERELLEGTDDEAVLNG